MANTPIDPSALYDLSGQVALVTGPGRGLGKGMALALARAGADIAGLYRRTYEEVETEVKGMGRRFLPIQLDLLQAQKSELAAVVQQVVAHFGRLDILVNNAGIIRRTPAIDYTAQDWQDVLHVNLTSAFYLSQAAARVMLDRPLQKGTRGKIIQVASLLAFQGGILIPAYTAAKHGLAGLTQALANEWAAHAINVNAIAPGYMVTDNTQALRDDPERNASILARIPAGRWGDPDDLAGITLFLASPASNYVHGATIPVDGGWLGR